MFEFTKRSRKVLEEMAQSEGRRLNSDSLGPEHIFIALLNDEDSVAARIMKNLGINFERLKKEIEQAIRQTGTTIILGKIPISPRYKRIIELSKEEARKLKNSYIGTEHLLLSIFRDGTSAGLDSLIKAGIDYNVIRNEILRVLGVKVGTEKVGKPKTVTKPPALEEFAQDLTKLASENMLDPVIGRNEETNRVIRILSRKRKNNPILIGEAGVGKTAIVEGLAQRIVAKQVPEQLQACRVMSLDMAAIVAGTKYRGEFEDRLKRVVEEIRELKNVIIFIDEIHTIIGAGAAEGAIDAANILKPALARGELQCIGATTLNEYRLHVEKDAALVRRFQAVMVDEPTIDESLTILRGLKLRYEEHHKVQYRQEALEEAVHLSSRYINDRYLPDKAIDIIDEAGAMARLENYERPGDITSLENEIEELNRKKNELVLIQEYEQAAAVRDLIIVKKEQLNHKLEDWNEKRNDYAIIVDLDKIAAVVAESTGIPIENLEESETEKLIRMESELHHRIVGQDQAISVISKALRRSRVGLTDDDRPLGSFIFLGPTGVGKTELAKALAEFLFDDGKNLIRLDMSEYMEKHSVARLIGSPPGYIGYDDGGQLSEKVRRKPYSIVLFDEIEKAHPDIFNILLQILDEGELTDSAGTTVSFRDTIIIMTSNLGNREYQKMSRLGFSSAEIQAVDNNDKVEEELKKLFSPEFINRVDEIVFFHKLEKKHIKIIVDLMLNEVKFALGKRKIEIEFAPGVKKHLIDMGFSENYGARNLRRTIRREVEDNLALQMLKGQFDGCSRLRVVMKGGNVSFKLLEKNYSRDENLSGRDDESADTPVVEMKK
ncbi:MAG: ATP-dependent Clp protease ATP-binding protein ClpC [Spirochaetae bacterium HGW-Spirochaetae-1]|jgi:ATP-dependent Clp protease ATP-binding subunit ClpC|nr:MAG: ATP-dependent Clp protease ATP-binding protein ClpC [Spirochaetae bacterium HGW-Spirochaetae-1]